MQSQQHESDRRAATQPGLDPEPRIQEHDDDRPVGRLLSRREVLALFGAITGVAILDACAPAQPGSTQPAGTPVQPTPAAAAATPLPPAPTPTQAAATAAATQTPGTAALATPACVVKPALTEGPYFVDEKLNRSDIRSDPSDGTVKPGAPLTLTLRVYQISSGCKPLAGAQVDIWHCDALGVYSDASDPTFGSTKGKKFLRGYQVTDANGTVQFTTIYPGWYQGRAVHVHFKIRASTATRANYDFTSQWFFDETLTDQVYAQAPYAAKGQGRLKNTADGIFQQGGNQLVLNVVKSGQGYAATFDIGLQLS